MGPVGQPQRFRAQAAVGKAAEDGRTLGCCGGAGARCRQRGGLQLAYDGTSSKPASSSRGARLPVCTPKQHPLLRHKPALAHGACTRCHPPAPGQAPRPPGSWPKSRGWGAACRGPQSCRPSTRATPGRPRTAQTGARARGARACRGGTAHLTGARPGPAAGGRGGGGVEWWGGALGRREAAAAAAVAVAAGRGGRTCRASSAPRRRRCACRFLGEAPIARLEPGSLTLVLSRCRGRPDGAMRSYGSQEVIAERR